MSERFYCEEWGCWFDSPLEKLEAECSALPWFDPDNEVWNNRFSEKKEWELRKAFTKAGRLREYLDGKEEL